MKLAQHNGGCVVVQNIEIYEKDNRFSFSGKILQSFESIQLPEGDKTKSRHPVEHN